MRRVVAFGLPVVLAGVLLVALPAIPSGAAAEQAKQIVVESEGNRLTVLSNVPVVFTTIEALLAGIEA